MKKIALTILSLFLMETNGYLEAKNHDYLKINNDNYSQRFETKNVQNCFSEGFNFHVADYADGSRVVTCLDGPEKGTQIIFFNGTTVNECRSPQWNSDHFVHYYQHGKISSYPNKQIAEFY